jgi:hypothetical protein
MRKKKHPKDMTTDEALKHIFHPKIVQHVKQIVKHHNAPKVKKSTTKES